MLDLDAHTERHPWLTDAVVVVALLGSTVLGVNLVGPGENRAEEVWIAGAVSAVACLVLFRGRGHPRAAVVVTTLCMVVTGALGFLLTPLLLAPVMVALYWLAVTNTSRTTWIYGGVSTASIVTTAVGTDIDEMVALRAVGPALWLLLPLVMGSRFRLRHAYLDAVQARAEHAERTREEEARLRVTEERMRIARDLHDVVAHHVSVMGIQAGAARRVLDSDPEKARDSLQTVEQTARTAIKELRGLLGVLRADAEPDLRVNPGLDDLQELLDNARAAGLQVEHGVYGDPREVSPAVALSAYRVVQEALTNVVKHADAERVDVRMRFLDSALELEISDDGRGRPTAQSPGFGLVGMRERLAVHGGSLETGPRRDAGYLVRASLPTEENA